MPKVMYKKCSSAGNLLQKGEIPSDVPEVVVTLAAEEDVLHLVAILNRAGLTKNSAAAKDVIQRNAVFVDGALAQPDFCMRRGMTHVVQAGKKAIARVSVV